ncbi:MAG: virulence protein RhuM/Fic/DOC family protein [Hyphomicrobium sp.]|jgi:prophage maintenance system killer protein
MLGSKNQILPGDVKSSSIAWMNAATPDSASQEIALYTAPGGEVRMDVRVDAETVWLTQRQMAELFDTSTDNVGLHLKNVYADGELAETATAEDYSVVQTEGRRKVRRDVRHYNLDAIISVGYRVNSKRGTQFRIWATKTLREHLIKGYTVNERRLKQRGLVDIEQTVQLLGRTLRTHQLVTDEGEALLDVVSQYARSWRLLLQYDENRLPSEPTRPTRKMARLTVNQAHKIIVKLKKSLETGGDASSMFGAKRGEGLEGVLGAIEQTFGGEPLYPSVEVRAAHLLYFVIKDHPFADGNKRIGSLLFLHYLDKNKRLTGPDGRPRFDDRALVALALLIAESDPQQKDVMVRLVMNLLEDPQ